MLATTEIKEGQSFRDVTGLSVTIREVVHDRVRFSVSEDQLAVCGGAGEMSCLAFVHRFSRIDSIETDCARIRSLGYVASRHIRIYGKDYELLSDPFPQSDRVMICAKAKEDSSVRVIGLPVTIMQNSRRREYLPGCTVCKGPVDLRTAKTDGDGHAVHEECYLLNIGLNRDPNPLTHGIFEEMN
jgi:hypothetical protein